MRISGRERIIIRGFNQVPSQEKKESWHRRSIIECLRPIFGRMIKRDSFPYLLKGEEVRGQMEQKLLWHDGAI